MCATWIRLVVPSPCAVRNNLDCDIFGVCHRLVNYVVNVSTAQVSEALASTVGLERAVVMVDRERSIYHVDQTGTGMRVPTGLPPGMKDVLGDIEIRISLYFGLQIPTA